MSDVDPEPTPDPFPLEVGAPAEQEPPEPDEDDEDPEPAHESVSSAGSGMKTTAPVAKRAYNKKPRLADGEWGRDWVQHEKCAGVGCKDCNGGLVPPT